MHLQCNENVVVGNWFVDNVVKNRFLHSMIVKNVIVEKFSG